MVEALATAIEFRSEESGAHVQRIHDITRHLLSRTELGQGLSPGEIEEIALASILHDVGKIAVPDAILNKPGRLTPEEFAVMKTHTVQGARLLGQIPQLRRYGAYRYAVDIARHHHERWDGRGYPDGLKGTRSPFGPRWCPWRTSTTPSAASGSIRTPSPGAGAGDDPGGGVRGVQPQAAGVLLLRGGGAVPAVSEGGAVMNLERRAQLEAAGVDVGQALARMMGSEALLERLLGKFLEEPNYAALCAALERREPEAAAAAAHGLKGACGNLSMTALYGLFTRQVDACGRGSWRRRSGSWRRSPRPTPP